MIQNAFAQNDLEMVSYFFYYYFLINRGVMPFYPSGKEITENNGDLITYSTNHGQNVIYYFNDIFSSLMQLLCYMVRWNPSRSGSTCSEKPNYLGI